jgi:hypothetical protein
MKRQYATIQPEETKTLIQQAYPGHQHVECVQVHE